MHDILSNLENLREDGETHTMPTTARRPQMLTPLFLVVIDGYLVSLNIFMCLSIMWFQLLIRYEEPH